MKALVIGEEKSTSDLVTLALHMRWPEAEVVNATCGQTCPLLPNCPLADVQRSAVAVPGSEPPAGGAAVLLIQGAPDVVILDVGSRAIPRCYAAIHDQWQAPVLNIISSDDEVNRLKALEDGADDFIAKPISPLELLAKVNAALRRFPASAEQSSLRVCHVISVPLLHCTHPLQNGLVIL